MGRPRSSSNRTALGRWLAKGNIAYAEAARELGVHPRYVVMMACGSVTPGLRLALAIQKWTKGAAPVDSWRKPEKKKVRK